MQLIDSEERQLVLIVQPQYLLIACIARLSLLAIEVLDQSSHHQRCDADRKFPIYASVAVPLLD